MNGVRSHPEAQARWFLWLFPAWMRSGRGEEALALVLDQLGTEADRLPWRSRADLVLAGLHARCRGTPPMRIWWMVAGAEPGRAPYVGARWRPWLLDGLAQRGFRVRVNLARMAPISLAMASFHLVVVPPTRSSGLFLLLLLLLSIGMSLLPLRWQARRRALYQANGCDAHGRDLPGHLLEPGRLPARAANLPMRWVAAGAALPPALLAAVGRLDRSPDGPVGLLQPWDPAGATPGRIPVLVVPMALAGVWALRRSWRVSGRSEAPPPERQLAWQRWMNTFVVFGAWSTGVALYGVFMAEAHSGVGAAASLALAAAVVWLVTTVAEQVIGRQLGVWDMVPSLGPRTCLVWAQPRYPELPPPPAMWLR